MICPNSAASSSPDHERKVGGTSHQRSESGQADLQPARDSGGHGINPAVSSGPPDVSTDTSRCFFPANLPPALEIVHVRHVRRIREADLDPTRVSSHRGNASGATVQRPTTGHAHEHPSVHIGKQPSWRPDSRVFDGPLDRPAPCRKQPAKATRARPHTRRPLRLSHGTEPISTDRSSHSEHGCTDESRV